MNPQLVHKPHRNPLTLNESSLALETSLSSVDSNGFFGLDNGQNLFNTVETNEFVICKNWMSCHLLVLLFDRCKNY